MAGIVQCTARGFNINPVPFHRALRKRSHIAHVLLGALAALDDPMAVKLYDRLRVVYNLTLPLGSLPVPSLEEWQGISSFCQAFHCRWVVEWLGLGTVLRFMLCGMCNWFLGVREGRVGVDGIKNICVFFLIS